MEAMRVRRQRRRHPPDARGGTSALRRRRHGRSMGRRKGAPDVGPPRRGLPTRSNPRLLSNSAGPPRRGDFATSNSVGSFLPDPDFQQAPGPGPIPHCVTRSWPSLRNNGLSLPPEFQHQIRGTTHDRIILPRRALHVELAAVAGRGDDCRRGASKSSSPRSGGCRRPAMSAQRALRGGKQTSGQVVKSVENDPKRNC
jgi:hypothetical protein